MIQSVLGPVEPKNLGFVLPHEHVFLDGFGVVWSADLLLDDPKIASAELQLYKEAGGHTILEMTPHGLNPDPGALREVSLETGLTVVAGTGLYVEMFHPEWSRNMSVEDFGRFFVGELTQGMAGTDVRAGFIGELGTGSRAIAPSEERAFRGAAIAQREVGVPLFTHAPFGRIGLRQVALLEEAGADLDRVVIGHIDTVHDVDYHEELARTGAWIAYDTVGRPDTWHDGDRADALVDLVRRGFADRILISSDICRRSHLHYWGGHGYDHVLSRFLPMLRERGLGEDVIEQMTRQNPRRLFEG